MTNQVLSLKAKVRSITGKKVNDLRKQGKIPAVLYGHKVEPMNLMVDYAVFEKIFKQAGESTLVDLVVDDKEPVKVIINDYQLDPKINEFIHVDFHQVRMDEELHAEVGIKFIGEAPAVKELSGVLVKNLDSLEVKCLPKDLIHEIEVDLSPLKTFDDAIHVADVKVPEGVTVTNVPDDVVVLVQPPRIEEKFETETTEGEETEGEEKGEKAGEGEAKPEEGEGDASKEK